MNRFLIKWLFNFNPFIKSRSELLFILTNTIYTNRFFLTCFMIEVTKLNFDLIKLKEMKVPKKLI